MQNFNPGYLMHPSHGRMLATTPWGWRPALIVEVSEHTAVAEYVQDEGRVRLWHHTSLTSYCVIGEPVRVHEGHHGLEIEDFWLNVRIDAGIGAVPDPADPELWAAEQYGVIINAANGQGIRISPDVMRQFKRD
jgi:hypothetical protein